MPNHLFDLIRLNARDDAAEFLRTPEGRAITYGDLFAFSSQAANELIREGVAPGDRVVARLDKVPAALILYLACLRAGAVFVPLNPAYTQTEVGYFLADAEPRLFVPDLRAFAGRGHQQVSTFADVERSADDIAAILYTSGTTGKSKGAMLTHANLASNAIALRDTWRWSKDDVLIHALPIFHTHGLFVATTSP